MFNDLSMSTHIKTFTAEKANANRAGRVVLGPCADLLRDILRKNVHPEDFDDVIRHKSDRLPFLTPTQREKVLPQDGQYFRTYIDMDLSLIYILLSTIAEIQPHLQGWGEDPDPGDRSVSANIDRILMVRNTLGYWTSEGLPQIDFDIIWSTISQAVEDLDEYYTFGGKYMTEVDCLRHKEIDPEHDVYYMEELQRQVKYIQDISPWYASTANTTYATRASRVLLGPCTDQLRDVLRKEVPLSQFPTKINGLRGHRNLTPSQKKILFPGNKSYSGNFSDMDITLLYFLLRNIPHLVPEEQTKKWGKDPDPSDRSLLANIERIRMVRNNIGHSTQTLSRTEFQNLWSTVRSTVVDLDNYLNNGHKFEESVDFLRKETMDPEREWHLLQEIQEQVAEDQKTREMIQETNKRVDNIEVEQRKYMEETKKMMEEKTRRVDRVEKSCEVQQQNMELLQTDVKRYREEGKEHNRATLAKMEVIHQRCDREIHDLRQKIDKEQVTSGCGMDICKGEPTFHRQQTEIKGRPSKPTLPFRTTKVTNTSITLTWGHCQDSGGSENIRYLVKVYNNDNHFLLDYKSVNPTYTYKKSQENPDQQIKFDVLASNGYCVSSPLQMKRSVQLQDLSELESRLQPQDSLHPSHKNTGADGTIDQSNKWIDGDAIGIIQGSYLYLREELMDVEDINGVMQHLFKHKLLSETTYTFDFTLIDIKQITMSILMDFIERRPDPTNCIRFLDALEHFIVNVTRNVLQQFQSSKEVFEGTSSSISWTFLEENKDRYIDDILRTVDHLYAHRELSAEDYECILKKKNTVSRRNCLIELISEKGCEDKFLRIFEVTCDKRHLEQLRRNYDNNQRDNIERESIEENIVENNRIRSVFPVEGIEYTIGAGSIVVSVKCLSSNAYEQIMEDLKAGKIQNFFHRLFDEKELIRKSTLNTFQIKLRLSFNPEDIPLPERKDEQTEKQRTFRVGLQYLLDRCSSSNILRELQSLNIAGSTTNEIQKEMEKVSNETRRDRVYSLLNLLYHRDDFSNENTKQLMEGLVGQEIIDTELKRCAESTGHFIRKHYGTIVNVLDEDMISALERTAEFFGEKLYHRREHLSVSGNLHVHLLLREIMKSETLSLDVMNLLVKNDVERIFESSMDGGDPQDHMQEMEKGKTMFTGEFEIYILLNKEHIQEKILSEQEYINWSRTLHGESQRRHTEFQQPRSTHGVDVMKIHTEAMEVTECHPEDVRDIHILQIEARRQLDSLAEEVKTYSNQIAELDIINQREVIKIRDHLLRKQRMPGMATGDVKQYCDLLTPVVCDGCGGQNDVINYCLQCDGNICDGCKPTHCNTRLTRDHIIIHRKHPEAVKARRSKKIYCSHHIGKEYVTYCVRCSESCCTTCITEKHKGHTFTDLEKIIIQTESEIDTLVHDLETNLIPLSEEAMSTLDEEITSYKKDMDEIKRSAKQRIQRLIQQLGKAEEIFLSEVDTLGEKHLKIMEMKKRELNENIDKIKLATAKGKSAPADAFLLRLKDEISTISTMKPSQITCPGKPSFNESSFQLPTVNDIIGSVSNGAEKILFNETSQAQEQEKTVKTTSK